MTVFRSESAYLRVTFPPETFGMGDGVEEKFDANGNVVAMRMPFRSAKFQMGMYETDNEGEKKRLRQHASFDGLFWEEKEADTTALGAFSSQRGAKPPPEGVRGTDLDRLQVMADVSTKSLSEDKKGWAIAEMGWAVQRFHVTGFIIPTEDRKAKVVRAGMVTLMDILDEDGITDEPKSEDIGADQGLDGEPLGGELQ